MPDPDEAGLRTKTREKPMKICILSTILNAHTIRWARALLSRGHDVLVISSEPNIWGIRDIPVRECPAGKPGAAARVLVAESARTLRICKILRGWKPDIVHIHSLDYIHPLVITTADCVSNCFPGLVVSVWGSDIIGNKNNSGSWLGRAAKKMLLRRAGAITATTCFLAGETAKLVPVGKPVHVVPFGIDCRMFRRLREHAPGGAVRIVFVKHLEEKYGPDILLRALPIVRRQCPDVRLTMVGHGSREPALKALAENLGVDGCTKFTGYLPYEKVPGVLEEADIFVMPSVEASETFGVSAIEAQAMEVPVVASDIGGIPEALINGKTGLLVPPKDIEKLAAAISELAGDPGRRAEMGRSGRKFVQKNFDIEKNVLLFEDIYRSLSPTAAVGRSDRQSEAGGEITNR